MTLLTKAINKNSSSTQTVKDEVGNNVAVFISASMLLLFFTVLILSSIFFYNKLSFKNKYLALMNHNFSYQLDEEIKSFSDKPVFADIQPQPEELGPDVEDEIAFDELIDIDEKKALPDYYSLKVEINPVNNYLANLSISGIICDLENNYVFIDGKPYAEKENFGGITIKKVTYNNVLVYYKNQDYVISIKQ